MHASGSLVFERPLELWRPPHLSRRLETRGKLDQRPLIPASPHKRDSDWQTVHVASGEAHQWIDREIEYYYVLEGALEIMDGSETFAAPAGTFVTIPKGALHHFKNVGTETAKMLLLFTPGGVEGMFFAIGTPATPGSSASPPDAAEVERVLSIAPEYGMEVPPPLLKEWLGE